MEVTFVYVTAWVGQFDVHGRPDNLTCSCGATEICGHMATVMLAVDPEPA